jgi:hypothetical protein
LATGKHPCATIKTGVLNALYSAPHGAWRAYKVYATGQLQFNGIRLVSDRYGCSAAFGNDHWGWAPTRFFTYDYWGKSILSIDSIHYLCLFSGVIGAVLYFAIRWTEGIKSSDNV